jgi:hypothetical protein
VHDDGTPARATGNVCSATPMPADAGSSTKAFTADVMAAHLDSPGAARSFIDDDASKSRYTSRGDGRAAIVSAAHESGADSGAASMDGDASSGTSGRGGPLAAPPSIDARSLDGGP